MEILIVIAAVLALAAVLLLVCGVRLRLSAVSYTLKSPKLEAPLRLALLADLHSGSYGEGQCELLDALREGKPDAVLFAGDIIDNHGSEQPAWNLLEQAGRRYPCFYVTGNHEEYTKDAARMKEKLRRCGVVPLEGGTVTVRLKGQTLLIGGADDPYRDEAGFAQALRRCKERRDPAVYSILLSHRPERVKAYRQSGFDLVVCGHAHGGQVRLPGLINGLFAPGQGLFPRYAGGCYPLSPETVMVVSRGLAKNHKLRVFNPPELVWIQLAPGK